MKTYVCRNIKLYSYLTTKGFIPYETTPDSYNHKMVVWLYESTDKLQNTINEYCKTIKQQNKYTNTKKIFSKRLALYLKCKGCNLLRTEPNRNKPQFDVYIFENDDLLQSSLSDYMDNK